MVAGWWVSGGGHGGWVGEWWLGGGCGGWWWSWWLGVGGASEDDGDVTVTIQC